MRYKQVYDGDWVHRLHLRASALEDSLPRTLRVVAVKVDVLLCSRSLTPTAPSSSLRFTPQSRRQPDAKNDEESC